MIERGRVVCRLYLLLLHAGHAAKPAIPLRRRISSLLTCRRCFFVICCTCRCAAMPSWYETAHTPGFYRRPGRQGVGHARRHDDARQLSSTADDRSHITFADANGTPRRRWPPLPHHGHIRSLCLFVDGMMLMAALPASARSCRHFVPCAMFFITRAKPACS